MTIEKHQINNAGFWVRVQAKLAAFYPSRRKKTHDIFLMNEKESGK